MKRHHVLDILKFSGVSDLDTKGGRAAIIKKLDANWKSEVECSKRWHVAEKERVLEWIAIDKEAHELEMVARGNRMALQHLNELRERAARAKQRSGIPQ